MTFPWVELLVALALAAVHLSAGALGKVDGAPRRRRLSAAAGAAVAYIFLYVLPGLASSHGDFHPDSEAFYFVIALAGFVGYYGIERHARRVAERAKSDEERQSGRLFWVHVVAFSIYGMVIGYLLLHRDSPGIVPLLLYGGAMALHFLAMDDGLRLHREGGYDHVARWILAGSVLVGWLAGWLLPLPDPVVDGLFALIAGAMVLNVMKDELPEQHKSSFGAFLAGAAGYSVLLLALE